MAKGVGSVELIRKRGKLVVHSMGRSSRGQKFLKEMAVLEAEHIHDKEFKGELATAVDKLLA